VLGANDGLLSTSSLIIGVASAHASRESVLIAGLVAGAMSMAAGEFVSVSSQADCEKSDLAREGRELKDNPHGEAEELTRIYVKRGPDAALARDALAAHARDEWGLSEDGVARPVQAAFASAAAPCRPGKSFHCTAQISGARWPYARNIRRQHSPR
jgi:VIT1/CCC1 family predicted Fe2+/Mn2+ transporter